MKKEKHNGIIGIWKFIFAIVIMLFHSRRLYIDLDTSLFKGGYIAVEFFFIVSGFYFAKNTLKEYYKKETIGKETINLIWKKIKVFFPYILVAYLINVIVKIIFSKFKIVSIVNSIWNLLLLKEFGFRGPIYSGQLWYLSVIFISLFILYPLVKKYKKNFIQLYSPIIVIFILGALNRYKLGLDHSYANWIGYMNTGILRGFADINIGMLIYLLNEKLKNVEYTKLGKIVLSLISEGLLILVLLITSKMKNFVHYDYVMLLFIVVSVTIMVSKKTIEYELLSNKISNYLEKISLPIFINHSAIIDLCFYSSLIKLSPVKLTIIVVISTILLSIIEMQLIKLIKKKQLISKCSKLIIKSY